MSRLRLTGVAAIVAVACTAGTQPTVAATKKKTGCAALKTKKQQTACKKARKAKKYRRGQVCSLSKKMGEQYRKHGYFCLDISAGQDGSLTYLEELGR